MKQQDIIFCNYSITESFYQIRPWEHAQYAMVLGFKPGQKYGVMTWPHWTTESDFFLAGLLKKQSFKKDFFFVGH